MAQFVLTAIDGSGSADWRKPDGSNSHVYKFYRDFRTGSEFKNELHGPGTLGTDTNSIYEEALRRTLRAINRAGLGSAANMSLADSSSAMCVANPPMICLVGHSRGGLIAINVAAGLAAHGHRVGFLGLYDAVDRALFIEGGRIRNIDYTYHALHSAKLGSRWHFSNTGRRSDAAYVEKPFMTSHGGIGGDPVTDTDVWNVTGDSTCDLEPALAKAAFAGAAKALNRARFGDVMHFNKHATSFLEKVDLDLERKCISESQAANRWIRDNARLVGVPI